MFFVYKTKVLKMPTNNLKKLYKNLLTLRNQPSMSFNKEKEKKKIYLSFYFNDKKEFMLTFL